MDLLAFTLASALLAGFVGLAHLGRHVATHLIALVTQLFGGVLWFLVVVAAAATLGGPQATDATGRYFLPVLLVYLIVSGVVRALRQPPARGPGGPRHSPQA